MGVARVLQQGEVPGIGENLLQGCHRWFSEGQLFCFIQGLCEGEHRLGDFGAQPQLPASAERFAQGDVFFFGQKNQGVLGCRTNSAFGGVEYPTKSEGVRRVGNRHQVGNRVLDFCSLIKLGAPNYAIGNSGADENIFQRPGLRVCSIKHGHLRVGHTLPGELHNLVGNKLCLIVGAVPREANDLLTRAEIGEQVLGFPVKVVADHGIGRIEDVLGGAVVLLQQHHLRTGKITLKFGDVANVSPSESVNRLVRVTHHRERCAGNGAIICARCRRLLGHTFRGNRSSELPNERVLRVVCVLILIHQDVAKARLILGCHIRERPEQIHRLANQVVKIKGLGSLQLALIAIPDLNKQCVGGVL